MAKEVYNYASAFTRLRVQFLPGLRYFLSLQRTFKIFFRTIYERTEHYSVLKTYVVSAFWHGFYPGYYLLFISAGFITLSSRVVSINVIYG